MMGLVVLLLVVDTVGVARLEMGEEGESLGCGAGADGVGCARDVDGGGRRAGGRGVGVTRGGRAVAVVVHPSGGGRR